MISIVVPVYNAGAYIGDTIRMVAAQTYTDWELILVDDGSTDDSAERIEETLASLREKSALPGKVRLIRQANAGAAEARNRGVREAQGRYLAYLDADDIWYPEKLSRELAFLQEKDAAFVFTSYLFGDEEGRPTGRAVRVPEELDFRKAMTRTVIFTSTVLFDLEKTGKDLIMMPKIESEDTACWWQILRSGITAYGLDELLVVYRRPAHSLSSDKGKAARRIWGLYRKIAGLGVLESLVCLFFWGVRAVWRRVVPDAGAVRKKRKSGT